MLRGGASPLSNLAITVDRIFEEAPPARPGTTTEARVVKVEDARTSAAFDRLATEEPLEIRLRAGGATRSVAITMRTPGADFELAAGFLYSEGVVPETDAIRGITYCIDADVDAAQRFDIVNVDLTAAAFPALDALERHFTMTSACGVCGKAQLDALRDRGVARLASSLRLTPELICSLPDRLRAVQRVFATTGGLHAAAVFTADGDGRGRARGRRPSQRARQSRRVGAARAAPSARGHDLARERARELRTAAESGLRRHPGRVLGVGTVEPRRRRRPRLRRHAVRLRPRQPLQRVCRRRADRGDELRRGLRSVAAAALLAALAFAAAGRAETTQVTEFPLPQDGRPGGIAEGADGAMWFTEFVGDRIGRITVDGAIAEYALPAGSSPVGIAAGSDGALWFTETDADRIGRITTAGSIAHFALPAGSNPYGIVAGPDGALWFTANGSDRIGRISTSGERTSFALPPQSKPLEITAGADGALWFTETDADSIGRITTAGTITHVPLVADSKPSGIAAGPGKTVWFSELNRDRIARINPKGGVDEFALAPQTQPGELVGANGAVWFVTLGRNLIARVTPRGAVSSFKLPAGAIGIAAGPDNALWLTEAGAAKIARFQLP